MTSTTDLQHLMSHLGGLLRCDPALSLAQIAAWLDPLHFLPDDLLDDLLYDGREDFETLALHALVVARRCIPTLYTEMVAGVRSGWSAKQIEHHFCAGLKGRYPHLDLYSLYDMLYGIPVTFVGLAVTSPEFLEQHPWLAEFLTEMFGLTPSTTMQWQSEVLAIDEADYDHAVKVARPLVKSLIAQNTQPYADLAFLLMYLFSMTGNSLLDFTTDEYWDMGYEPLWWEPDNLTLAEEACQQVEVMLDAVFRALDTLQADRQLKQSLTNNIAAVQQAIERNEPHAELDWSAGHPGGGAGDTTPDPQLLLLRDCFIEED